MSSLSSMAESLEILASYEDKDNPFTTDWETIYILGPDISELEASDLERILELGAIHWSEEDECWCCSL